ncbi:MAG: alpha/beta hydrolase [Sinobacteraceae bacterium]|nr:alpha/beta hydrolase [Nevskiaceae bacterium]
MLCGSLLLFAAAGPVVAAETAAGDSAVNGGSATTGAAFADPQSWAPPAHATPGAVPVPAGVRVVRGYADTPLGQVHYQDVGDGPASASPAIVLLHQVPWFHVYYNRVQAELAARGYRSIAIDTPGYGLSARLNQEPAIADYAAAIDAVMGHLRLRRAAVAGHHTGSSIGVELARTYPQRVQCLMLHGVPLYTEAEARTRLEAPHWDQRYRTDGSHLADRWAYLGGRIAGSPDSVQWSTLSMWISGETEWYGHHAVFKYDMQSALAALRVPVVVFNNDLDLLGYTVERVRALRPDFAIRQLESRSSNMPFDEPAAWSDAVVEALGSCSKQTVRR